MDVCKKQASNSAILATPPRDRVWQRFLAVLLLCLTTFPLSGCTKLAKVSDNSIPRLLTPVATAELPELLAQLKPFTELQSLRASRVALRFIEPQAEERWRDAEGILVLQRPDQLRLIVQMPVTRSRIAEMVSAANQFRVAIYQGKPTFLLGTNTADYSRWQQRLGKDEQSAMANARPFHFTEALLMKPLRLGETGFAYSLEEQLQEEAAGAQAGQKSPAKVWRSFYVVTEAALAADGRARVLRKFWFDRNRSLLFTRQQLFSDNGGLATEVAYGEYQRLLVEHPALWPSVVTVARPYDKYAARFSFQPDNFEVNPTLPATAFTLENKESLPVTDLDKP